MQTRSGNEGQDYYLSPQQSVMSKSFLAHIGIDIDQFILLTIYPAAAFFAIGYIAKKIHMRQSLSYSLQAITCFAFAAVYYFAVPDGGAEGLEIVLVMFGIILVIMARRYKITPSLDQEGEKEPSRTGSKNPV